MKGVELDNYTQRGDALKMNGIARHFFVVPALFVYLASHTASIVLLSLLYSSLSAEGPSRKFGMGGDASIVAVFSILFVGIGGLVLQFIFSLGRDRIFSYTLPAAAALGVFASWISLVALMLDVGGRLTGFGSYVLINTLAALPQIPALWLWNRIEIHYRLKTGSSKDEQDGAQTL